MATERITVGLSESGRVSHIGVILGAFMNEQDRLDISTLDIKALNCDIPGSRSKGDAPVATTRGCHSSQPKRSCIL